MTLFILSISQMRLFWNSEAHSVKGNSLFISFLKIWDGLKIDCRSATETVHKCK